MIDSNSDQRHIKRLYDKFRTCVLSGNIPDNLIDEDDLISIYDYANDNGDEYVQLMAVICAMRQCPDNEDMCQRRAYFFTQNLGLADSAGHLMQGHVHESALWDILHLLVTRPKPDDACKAMASLVRAFRDFDDETIIQLVGACVELQILDWLCENKAFVQGRCLYQDTFLYELARACADAADHEQAIRLLDELTGIEPFNVLYWQLLADEYNQIEDFASALNAIDYALAIDGSNRELQLARAQILYDRNADRPLALSIVRELVETSPSDIDAAVTLCVMLCFENRQSEAKAVIEPLVKKFPSNRSVAANALLLGDRELNALALKGYINSAPELTDEEINAWAGEQSMLGRHIAAADILLAWLHVNGSITSWSLLLGALYQAGCYAEVSSLHENFMLKSAQPESVSCNISDLLLIALSHLRCGESDKSLALLEFVASVDIKDFSTMQKRLEAIGAKNIASKLCNIIETAPDKARIDDIDPFLL
ncbi:lipopolysaccharide assembly protein LapB [Muribaculum caecicola]|uniref:Uncharacterized protein n=1 Tax=Muribaculum caecicola TaxID=3038144 RepID=A0AC61S601_9BACT|nr:hypothetical protein [Muribaculum caecicola]THG51868.1 hypothetical protein E5990_05665 [Muribaculum caecicola]